MRPLGSRLMPRTGNALFLASLVFWNPLLAGALTFVLGGTHHFLRNWFVSIVISDVVALECFAAAHVVRRLETLLYRLRDRAAPVHSVGWHLLLSGIVMPFAMPLGFLAGGATAGWLGFSWGTPNLGSYRIGIGFGLVIMTLFFFQRTRTEAKDAARAAEARIKDLEAARLQAQLSALTAEMNPHLLFNALNTVASLIHRDPDRAEDVVMQLSDLYRGVLRSSGASTHALHEELGFCEAYLKIEQARFGDRLGVKIDVDPAIDPRSIEVPILVLQPFVENAVKHGISPRARGGHISMRVRLGGTRVEVCIEDDGIGLGHSTHRGAGKAMVNCKDRLRLMYGERASLEVADAPGGGTRVRIVMPSGKEVP